MLEMEIMGRRANREQLGNKRGAIRTFCRVETDLLAEDVQATVNDLLDRADTMQVHVESRQTVEIVSPGRVLVHLAQQGTPSDIQQFQDHLPVGSEVLDPIPF